MNTLLISFVLASACGSSTPAVQQSKSVAATSSAVPTGAADLTNEQPSKAAVAHYCSEMSALTPESFLNVPPSHVQAELAARMSESAQSKNLSDWVAFEGWLRATAPSERQPQLEQLIQKYGLQTVCLSVSSAPIR